MSFLSHDYVSMSVNHPSIILQVDRYFYIYGIFTHSGAVSLVPSCTSGGLENFSSLDNCSLTALVCRFYVWIRVR